MKVMAKPGVATSTLPADVEHLVIGIHRWVDREPFVMLLDDEGLPFSAPVSDVITVDDRIPSSWTAVIGDDGDLSVQPAPWQHPAFWHTFWGEGHPRAVELPRSVRPLFDEELARIRREVG